jgi:SlyX protein
MNEERLVEIESKLAYQENTIKDLNDTVIEQQKEIAKLKQLIDRIKESSNISSGDLDDNKPPHY